MSEEKVIKIEAGRRHGKARELSQMIRDSDVGDATKKALFEISDEDIAKAKAVRAEADVAFCHECHKKLSRTKDSYFMHRPTFGPERINVVCKPCWPKYCKREKPTGPVDL